MAAPPAGIWPIFDVAEMAEEAADRAGVDLRSGNMLRSARRSLELLSIEWGNRGLNLWTVEEVSLPLQPNVNEYTLADDTIDLIEHNLTTFDPSTGQPKDYPLTRMSIDEYSAIPNKTATGRPTIIYIRRRIPPTFVLWMVPPAGQTPAYTITYSRLRRMETVGLGGTGLPEIPWRFIPAMVAGLAFYLALKSNDPNVAPRVAMLKGAYEEAFTLASDEDRDRASLKWVPWGYSLP